MRDRETKWTDKSSETGRNETGGEVEERRIERETSHGKEADRQSSCAITQRGRVSLTKWTNRLAGSPCNRSRGLTKNQGTSTKTLPKSRYAQGARLSSLSTSTPPCLMPPHATNFLSLSLSLFFCCFHLFFFFYHTSAPSLLFAGARQLGRFPDMKMESECGEWSNTRTFA